MTVEMLGDDGRWVELGWIGADGFELDFSEPIRSTARSLYLDSLQEQLYRAASASLHLTVNPQWYADQLGEIPGTSAWRRRVARRRETLRTYLAAVERHEAREGERLREAVKYEADCDARATDPIMHELVARHEAYLREILEVTEIPVYSIEFDDHGTTRIAYEPPRPPLPDIRPAIEALWRDFDYAASLPLPGINGAAGVEHYRELRTARSASAATAQRLRTILDSRES